MGSSFANHEGTLRKVPIVFGHSRTKHFASGATRRCWASAREARPGTCTQSWPCHETPADARRSCCDAHWHWLGTDPVLEKKDGQCQDAVRPDPPAFASPANLPADADDDNVHRPSHYGRRTLYRHA